MDEVVDLIKGFPNMYGTCTYLITFQNCKQLKSANLTFLEPLSYFVRVINLPVPYIFGKPLMRPTTMQNPSSLSLTYVLQEPLQVDGQDHDAGAPGGRWLGTTYIFEKLMIRAIKVLFMITLEFCLIKKLF